ncbi:M20/M25/M40 family metallo-hydrolase [Streptomyces sp. RerS4]|uniref:M20/M25/M40 family metallo-hydrolase n=1 Tax=Streptomyces sp. RerS4 TaxID=2942449 RepID=UPI00201BA533|nr:M20/M25/M40 family metallo-hydrolase [Streptomyces sp. RerS4]UQW99658.1 M20/M25/M40 family metallo-hydrolase [Streptomyces sp. RerS4]
MSMRSRLSALSGVLLCFVALGCALLVRVPPEPKPEKSALSGFSAARAVEHIGSIARSPHPSGTSQAEAVRSYVTGELSRLGLSPQLHESTEVLPGEGGSHLAGRVHNVTATIPGRSSTGRVLLVAHTDSVATGPGASDDGLGVGSLLEIARALREGAPPRNDVVLLFTDMEETAQLGARAAARELARTRGGPDVVINLEARGTSGRAVMFETGPHSSALVAALGDAPPVATSLSDEIYRLLPNTTDFTQFRQSGATGLNFAVIGGSARYHGPEDDLDHVDLGSLQDLGNTAISATRALSSTDLARVEKASEATWFNLGPVLVHYPEGAVLPLALIATLASAAAVWYARRRRALSLRAVARAASTFPLTLLTAAALGWAAWQALLIVRPTYALFHLGDPYRTGPAVAGLLLLTAAVVWLWIVWVGKRAGAVEAAAGTAAWAALLAVVMAVLLPGAAYVFTWTALGGAAGVALAARTAERSPWRTAALAASALPAVAVTAPLVALLFPTVGLASAAGPLALAALTAAVVALPLTGRVAPVHVRRAVAGGAALAVVGGALVGVNAAIDAPDAEHPRPVSLMYALDADREKAVWVSEDADPHPWVTHYTGDRRTDSLERWSPALAAPPGGLLAGPAPVAPVSCPVVTSVSDSRDGGNRTLRLSVRPEAGRPTLLALYVDTTTTQVVGAQVSGAPAGTDTLGGGANRPNAGSVWKWGLLLVAPPAEGTEVTLTVRDTGHPVRLLAMTQEAGLPASAVDRPRPDDLTWDPHAAGVSFASRLYEL